MSDQSSRVGRVRAQVSLQNEAVATSRTQLVRVPGECTHARRVTFVHTQSLARCNIPDLHEAFVRSDRHSVPLQDATTVTIS